MKKNFYFLIWTFQLLTVIAYGQTSFEIQPFVTAESSDSEIKEGLKELYKNSISAELLETLSHQSFQYQKNIYSILNNQIAINKMHQVTVSEKVLTGNFVKETTVRFKSLIQRSGNHAANTVVARIYEPAIQKPFCDFKYPTTIMLHHILNQVGMIEDVAKALASGILSQPAVYVVLHMPHYGERREGQEDFLTSDFNQFKNNIAQLILDVHLLKNYLDRRPNVDTKNFTLSGISLGAVMGLTVGAFDQSFTGYGNLVGGVDMANILMNRARTRPDSEVAMALKNITLDEDRIRDEIAAVDPMTWLHRYKNKKFFFVSATQDDIIDYKNSVEPMTQRLKQQANHIEHKINDDTHSPSGSAFKKLKDVFLPLLRFIVRDSPTLAQACPAAY